MGVSSQLGAIRYTESMKRLFLLLMVLVACNQAEIPRTEKQNLVGQWRAVLESPGGDLPFGLEISDIDGKLTAVIQNGIESAPTSSVEVTGNEVRIVMDWYASILEGRVSENRSSIIGRWVKTAPSGQATLKWHAERGEYERFAPITESGVVGGHPTAVPEIRGHWRLQFADEEPAARAEFEQIGNKVRGTILTSTGDYRYLDGVYESGLLRLSTFDGAHAFLFHARAQPDGTLDGDFWSRDSYHTTWTAVRIDATENVLPNPWEEVTATREDRHFSFKFDDLEGNSISSNDPLFDNKVTLIVLFGSWCPNCNDEAPVLNTWAKEYGPQGLEVIGLAFEFSGDPDRDRRILQRYAERHHIEFPILLAGVSDKAEASHALPDISAVLSYPTTIFLGRDRRIRWIHSGFAGPGTGQHHVELVAEMEKRVTELLAE